MGAYFGATAGVLIAVICILTLEKQGKEMALLLSILVCCSLGVLAVSFLKPVLDFVGKLEQLTNLDGEFLKILLKVVGVALTGEIAALICTDAGSGVLGRMLQFLSGILVLWLSLPMLTALLELVEEILENI